MKISLAEGGKDKAAGIVFWAADFENCYAAIVEADGYVDVVRRMQGKRFAVTSPKVQVAVKQGMGPRSTSCAW